jgi:hypothetical protein
MDEKPSNHGKPWSLPHVAALKKLAANKANARIVAFELCRTEGAVRARTAELHAELAA